MFWVGTRVGGAHGTGSNIAVLVAVLVLTGLPFFFVDRTGTVDMAAADDDAVAVVVAAVVVDTFLAVLSVCSYLASLCAPFHRLEFLYEQSPTWS